MEKGCPLNEREHHSMKNHHLFPLKNICIESFWWSDPRKDTLTQLIKDPQLVHGAALELWRFARNYMSKGELIPGHAFRTLDHAQELLASGLAVEMENDFYYARGSRDLYAPEADGA